MILTLVVIILCLIVLTWVMAMYFSWKISEGTNPKNITQEAITITADKTTRLTRRGWYIALLYSKKALGIVQKYTNKVAGKIFFKIFPAAKEAFKDKDPNVAETPSPFLKEISDSKNGLKTHLSKDKKML